MEKGNVTSASSFLKEVRELFSDRKKHTQGVLARDKNGEEVEPCGPTATCWCLAGAMCKVAYRSWIYNKPPHYEEAEKMLVQLCPVGFVWYTQYNDAVGYEGVMELLDKVIAWLERLGR